MDPPPQPIPHWAWGIVVFVFGAVWGSFLNVCIWRMPREESIVKPGSHCGSCNTPIPWYHNIPLVSYFALGGKCYKCGATFAFRYWLVEFLNAALWLVVWREFQTDRGWFVVIAYCVLISMLLVGTFIDFEFYIIPDRITLGSILVGFVFSFVAPSLHQVATRWDSMVQSFLGIVTGGLSLLAIVELGKLAFGRLKIPLEKGSIIEIAANKIKFPEHDIPWEEIFFRSSDKIRFKAATMKFQDKTFENVDVKIWEKKMEVNGQEYDLAQVGKIEATTDLLIFPQEAMGLGDVKLMAGIGAFVGWKAIFFILMVSALLGSIVGGILVVLRLRQLQGRIPYGPYIALAALIWIFAGPEIVNWWMSMPNRVAPRQDF